MRRLTPAVVLAALAAAPATVPTTTPTRDADPVPLYRDAAKRVSANVDRGVMCPAASNLSYDEAPPYPPAWYAYEEADYPANAPARALARRARSLGHPHWPGPRDGPPDLHVLNDLRGLANELGDAALYQHLGGDDAAAVETVRDELHLADTLGPADPPPYLVTLLVGIGVRAQAVNRLVIVAADVRLSADPADPTAVRPDTVKALIRQLCDRPDPVAVVDASLRADESLAATRPADPRAFERSRAAAIRTAERVDAESGMAALSLACHLYRADHGRWPAALADLKPYCPTLPPDPFAADGRPLGYAMVARGLPDGTDRPLVYSRESDDGTLAFRADRPAYSRYAPPPDGHGGHPARGQFRDVTRWTAARHADVPAVPFAEP